MAKKLTWQNAEFKIGATTLDDIPPTRLNEIAFCGKSNVGKSSLINAITKRNNLVRTSRTPGCTRQLNFFELDELIYLVDMPGYGFAKRGKKELKGWRFLIDNYLTGRVNLRRIFLLIDSRRGLKEHDFEIIGRLDEFAVIYQIVLTKCDEINEDELGKVKKSVEDIMLRHPALHPEVLVTSSLKGIGLDKIRREIVSLV